MFKCSADPQIQCSNDSMFQCSNVPMYKCTNVSMFKCSNVQMNKCSNVLSRYSDPQHTLSLVHLPFFFVFFLRNVLYSNLFSRAGSPSGWVNHEVRLLSRFKCSNVQIFRWSNLQIFKCSNGLIVFITSSG